MQILSVFFCKIFLCHLHYNAGQQEHGDQVGNDHESIESLGDAPHESQVHGSAYDSCKGIQHHERHVGAGTEEELDTSRTVQSPANDRRKCETAHRHGGKDRYPTAIDSGESTDGQFRTGSFTVIYGHTAAQDDQRCHSTDDDGVHEYLKDTEEALLYRLLRIGTGVGDGSGTKTGFVGEDAGIRPFSYS